MNQIGETFTANRKDKESLYTIRETCSQLTRTKTVEVCFAKILLQLDFRDNDLFILWKLAQLSILKL